MKARTLVLLILLIPSVLFFLGGTCDGDGSGGGGDVYSASWRPGVIIDGKGYSGAIACDSQGEHISYAYGDFFDDTSTLELRYATNASGSWVTTTIDATIGNGWYSSIDTDSNDKVHISYYDSANMDLKYATNLSGSWVTSTIDSTGDVGSHTSLAVDSNDKVHICYYDGSNGNLKYATNVSGSWVASTIDGALDVGRYNSLAIVNNNVHISYYDDFNTNLKYATNASGSWGSSTIDSTGVVGAYSSITATTPALSDEIYIHISYYDGDNGDLKYAMNSSGSWVVSTLKSEGDIGQETSIASIYRGLHDLYEIHICYYDVTKHDLVYIVYK
jgi:hypothetical protein